MSIPSQSLARFAAASAAFGLLTLASGLAAAEPPPGHPSAEQAGRLLGLPPARPPAELPHTGKVLRAIESNAFTFVEVEEVLPGGNSAARWIAVPRIDLQPGMRIAFDDGRLMTGFYSRKHQITFESITFVDRAVALPGAPTDTAQPDPQRRQPETHR